MPDFIRIMLPGAIRSATFDVRVDYDVVALLVIFQKLVHCGDATPLRPKPVRALMKLLLEDRLDVSDSQFVPPTPKNKSIRTRKKPFFTLGQIANRLLNLKLGRDSHFARL
jgi:hypothetical protein